MDSLGLIYVVAIFFIKVSICLLYLRIFGVERSFRLNVYGGIVFCAIFYLFCLAWFIATVTLCWGPSILGVCANAETITLTTSVLNVCTDVYLLVLPIRSVLKMQLRQRQRVRLLFVFLSGSV